MTTFLKIVYEARSGPARSAEVAEAIEARFGVGCRPGRAEDAFDRTSGLHWTHRTTLDLFDTPGRDTASQLTAEEDWADQAEVDVPRSLRDRLTLIAAVAQCGGDLLAAGHWALGISDGGYFYEACRSDRRRLAERMMDDVRSDRFLGRIYIVSP